MIVVQKLCRGNSCYHPFNQMRVRREDSCLNSYITTKKFNAIQIEASTIHSLRHISQLFALAHLTIVIGVILLHLLLIPGVSFLAGGAQIVQQHLDPHSTQLNHSLLTIG